MNKNKLLFAKWITIVLVIAIGATGYRVAAFVSMANMYVARGVLGCVFIYFLSREVDFLFKGRSFEDLSNYPQASRYLVWVFGLFFLFYLGLHEVLQLIIFVIRSFIVG